MIYLLRGVRSTAVQQLLPGPLKLTSASFATDICRDLMIFSVTAAVPPATPAASPIPVPASKTGSAAPAERIV